MKHGMKDTNACIQLAPCALIIIVTALFILKQGQRNIKYCHYFPDPLLMQGSGLLWTMAEHWSTQLYSTKQPVRGEIRLGSLA